METQYTPPPKKLLILYVLEILRKYSDEHHPLSQKRIGELLQSDYSMKVDRKAIRRNLSDLLEAGFPIEYSETPRSGGPSDDAESNTVCSDFFLLHEFTDGELRLLIDSLLFSHHVPPAQCRALIEKLGGLSSSYFQTRAGHICPLPLSGPTNKELFLNIETLDEAISTGRQVSFRYIEYGADKRPHPRCNADGRPREYTVNPYQMAAANGRYYLIANCAPHEDIIHYRLDRIVGIRLLDTAARPVKELSGAARNFDLPHHMAEHVYMFAGASGQVTFRAKKYLITDLMDWFGKDLTFSEESEDEVTVSVRVNFAAMRRWALQYALHIRILSPSSLAEQVADDVRTAAQNYGLL